MLAAQEGWQKSASPLTFKSATEIFRQGDMPQAVWFINSGSVKLVRLESEGQQLIVNLRSAGRWIGLASAIKRARYEFAAVTLTKCSLQCLPIETFHQLLKTDPDFSWRILQAMSDNYIELYARTSQIANTMARDQLKQYLWRTLTEQGLNGTGNDVRLRLPLKHKEIAQMINVTPQYISELFKEVEDEGLVRWNGKDLIIIDPQRLRHESSGAGY